MEPLLQLALSGANFPFQLVFAARDAGTPNRAAQQRENAPQERDKKRLISLAQSRARLLFSRPMISAAHTLSPHPPHVRATWLLVVPAARSGPSRPIVHRAEGTAPPAARRPHRTCQKAHARQGRWCFSANRSTGSGLIWSPVGRGRSSCTSQHGPQIGARPARRESSPDSVRPRRCRASRDRRL